MTDATGRAGAGGRTGCEERYRMWVMTGCNGAGREKRVWLGRGGCWARATRAWGWREWTLGQGLVTNGMTAG